MDLMPNISSEPKTGILIKENNKWFVDYASEKAGSNTWHNKIPVYGFEHESEVIADLKLVEMFNKPVSELNGMPVVWSYVVTGDYLHFGYEYALLRVGKSLS
jgi:hypothetical protein